MRNWGPFYNEHKIDLAVGPSAPVVLFRGENMRGKTSLSAGHRLVSVWTAARTGRQDAAAGGKDGEP